MPALLALGALLAPRGAAAGSSILVAGQPFEVGRPVVLWSDPEGFNGYARDCIESAYREELSKLPAEYATRPTKDLIINGHFFHAYDLRPEQYASILALVRVLVKVFPAVRPVYPERDGKPWLETLPDPNAFAGIVGHL